MPNSYGHINNEDQHLFENHSASPSRQFSLSSTQQAVWLDQILRPNNPCYNIGSVIQFEGELDEALLVRAFEIVVGRHDALRLKLINTQKLPLQEIMESAPVSVTIHDFTGYTNPEEHAEQHIRAAFMHPFDLNSELWRFELLRVSENRWYWQFCCHHLIGDGITLGLIPEDIANIYSLLIKGEQPTETPPSYLDYVNEDRAYQSSQRYMQDRQFWLERYKNLPPALIKSSTANQTIDYGHSEPLSWQLDNALFQRIENLVNEHGLSVLHFMYAILACYFSRTLSFSQATGSEEIVIGIPVHNRKNVRQKRMVGMFSSVIPVGITVAPDDTFLDVMNKTAAELRRCYKRQRLPIAEINRHIRTQRKTGHTQLFDVMLSFEQIEVNAAIPNASLKYAKIQRGSPFPLIVAIHQYAFNSSEDIHKPFTLEFEFSPTVLSRDEVMALQSRFMVLIENALTSFSEPIRNLPILPSAERQQVLVDFNATQTDFSTDFSGHPPLIHQYIEAQAALHPDAVAIAVEEHTVSYGVLNQRANQLAHHLITLGVRPDERVAICVERSPDMVVGLLAILKAGGAYVPLDPAYPSERLAYMLNDAAPVALLTQTALAGRLKQAVPAVKYATLLLDAPDRSFSEQSTDNPDVRAVGVSPHHLAYVIYTSGSTGLPKGVEMPLAGLVNLLQWHRQPSHPAGTGKTLQFAALGFDVAFQEIFTTLCDGGCLVLINESLRRQPDQLLRLIARHRIDRIFLPYIALQHLADAAGESEADFSCLAHIVTAGEQLRITPAIQRFLHRAGNCRLHNHYGPTESHVTTAYMLEQEPAQWPVLPPIGRPIANNRIYILDADRQPVPLGVTGEIYIAGRGVARGYLNRPELTAERFLIDPFCTETGARMYKTGDLGRWRPDGNIDYLGRNDFQVKVRGFRVELGEIEAQLMRCHGVREAVVIARNEGADPQRLVAYLRPADGVKLQPAKLRQQLAQHLADYMLPSAFVVLNAFPQTPNGKLDRQALPAPDTASVATRAYEAPRGETEATLAQIWQALLGLERVGRHDHFFELGGHSLLAIQLVARVRQVLAKELPLQTLFAQPVLMVLAHTLTDTAETTQTAIPVVDDRQQSLPLSFAQQRLWFLTQLSPAASLAYHIPVALRLAGQLNYTALNTALSRLVARHESLRTYFISVEGLPYQRIASANIGFALPCHDLRQCDPALHNQRIAEFTDIDARTPFDFTHGPLIRGQLLQLADDEHVLLLTLHHIISDGWSIGVLVRELGTLYHAILEGQDDPLPALPIQYADYAAWQHEWLQGDLLATQRDFWYSQLEGAPALLTLPLDRPRASVQSYVGNQVPFHLDATTLASLKALGQHHNCTLFMTILAAWSIVLARLSGQDDIVIGTPVANRPSQELEGTIGFFVNTLALRITLHDDISVADLLAQVRERALAAYDHQDLPFEQVVEALQPERSLSYSPIFQVMLALDNTPIQEQTTSGLQISRMEQVTHSAHFDLMLLLTETDTGLNGGLEYASDLFDTATAERMVGYLKRILLAMASDLTLFTETELVAEPTSPTKVRTAATQTAMTLPMLSDAERQQLLVDFNATQADFPQHALIHQLFEAQAAKNPDATAVVVGNQTLTYGELNRRANRLAHYLMTLGVRPDDRVAICIERSPEMVVGLLGVLKAGGAYVPFDPAYPAERLAYMLEDSAPMALLTQTALANKLATSVPTIMLDAQAPLSQAIFSPTDGPDHNPAIQALTSHHLAYVIYTSGSTGLPKGVAIAHRNTVNFLTWAQRTFSPEELAHTLFATSLNFDLAVFECFAPLISGGTVHIVPDVLSLVAAKSADAETGHTGQTTSLINTVPSAIAHLIDIDAVPKSTRTINLAGEALKAHVVEQLFAHSAIQNVCNLYGPSETTTYSTWTRMDRATGFSPHIGRPIANTQIYILDPHGQPVALGVIGEIYIAGSGVARGYLNRPELTAERFIVDPFSKDAGARMYKTGDLGRWLPDGNIEYLGRNDFQVKLRGFRIELGEIEAQLMQCHGVREAVVIAREDLSDESVNHQEPSSKKTQKRLVAYLRPMEGAELQPADLRQQLAQHLAEYMLPSAFVMLDTFPLTSNGKLNRQALPAPDLHAVIARNYEAPAGEAEITLAQIWQDLLGLEQVSRHDHFFELGGHSLMIVGLIEQLYNLGWQLDVRSVFSSPILSEMALAVKQNVEAFSVPANLIPADCSAITPEMLPLITLSQAEIDAIVDATVGGARNIQDIYPLAPLQEGIFYHHLRSTQGDTYVLQCLLAFNTRERLDDFLSALQQVIDRHDILRTAICWQGLVQPAQVVWRQAPLHANVFIPETSEDIRAQLQAHTHPRRHRLDLSQAPLFAADIAHDPAQNEWLLSLRFHHLVCDHMTLELIFAEIAEIQQGSLSSLPETLPYRHFIAQILSTPATAHEAYFRTRLADIDAPTAPFGILSLQDDHEPTTEAQLLLDSDLAENIRAQARRLGVSPGVLFHVAWAQVLAQTSGHHHVVFGSVLLGRLQGGAGAARTLGMFINTLPVRISLGGQPADKDSVQDIVQDTYRQLTALLEHEQAPLALAQRCSGMAPSIPLFSTLLNYRHSQNRDSDIIEMPQIGMRIVAVEERANYPVTLSVDDMGTGFYLTAQTVTRIDPARMNTYLATALRGLVDALAHEPQRAIQSISILPPAERQQALVGFNPAPVDFPHNALIHQLFEDHVKHHPNAIALMFEEQSLSYGELNYRANQLAHYLIALGIRPDDRVAICAERSPELIIGLLAILKAGGAYVPLDPAYPAERLAYMLEDVKPVALLMQSAHASKMNGSNKRDSAIPIVLLDSLLLNTDNAFLTSQPSHNPAPHALGLTSRHLAYVIYTSGSTGLPKGVMVEHRSVLRLIINNGFADIGSDDCVAHCANTAFDASTWEIWAALLNGGRLHIVPQSVLLDPTRFCESLIKGGTTALWLTVGLFNEYLDYLEPLYHQLRYLIIGGDTLDPRKIQHMRSLASQPANLMNAYGPTETTTFATIYTINAPIDVNRSIPIGKPIANTRIYILDPHGQPVPVGAVGEIHIADAGVSRGYLNRPELTAERFIVDSFSPAPNARMYKTGDLGRWLPDGNIEYLGRNDFQVKLRGFRIELGEIEARLRQCDGVRDAVVIIREQEDQSNENGPGQKRLIAYVQPLESLESAGNKLDPAELRQQLAQHLADYMLPSAFVMLDAFPLTLNGKLDRQALPAPDLSAVAAHRYQAPESPMECALAEIWQNLLGLEQIGRHDNFFELGGHSLLAVQLIAHIRQELALELSLQQLFDHPLLLDLAQTLTDAATSSQVIIPVADRDQPLPLSFAQQRLWFFGQIDPSASLAYHIPVALRLTGSLNQSALSKALDHLVARHEILRTRFVLVGGQPCQHIDAADIGLRLAYHDLRLLTPEEQAAQITELTTLEAKTPFDFAQESLIRGQLLQLTSEEHILLLTQHHIISDGWSVGILMHELDLLYRAALEGSDNPLPPLPVQYADYAVWQRDWLQEDALTAQRDFWRTQLESAPALLTLPLDRPRPATQSFVGGHVPVHFDARLLASLKRLGQRHNSTLFMTVLAAWGCVLARLSGQNDIVIGTPVANRPHHELEGMIGFFVNTLALRVTLSDTLSVADLLSQIRKRALAAYAHQDLPFEQVVEVLHPERNLGYSPVFQVMLALNNTLNNNLPHTPASESASPELQFAPVEQVHPSAHFDLTLSLTETESGLIGGLTYAADLFDAATVERMVDYLANVLVAMTADETQPVATLPMLPASERQQLLVDFNATSADYPQDMLAHQLFEAQALQQPDAVAVCYEDQVLSYSELNDHANRLAHQLIALGVRPDNRVAVCTERGLEMVIALLAVLKAGGAYVPLDPAYPAERLTYMLDDSAPVVLLTQTAWSEKLSSNIPTIFLDNLLIDNVLASTEPPLSKQPKSNPDVQGLGLTSRHLAYVIYTSGSTGQPKGVMIAHQNLCNLITTQKEVLGLTADSRVLQFASNSFDACIWECCIALLTGARLYLAQRADILPGAALSGYLESHAITHTLLSPTALTAMDSLPATLQTLLVGGEACPSTLVKRWAKGRQMFNAYGPTEITVYASLYACHGASGNENETGDNPPPIGRPIANARIYILDANAQPVPLGVMGEIYIAGAGVARGYLNRPELTAERFLADPFSTEPDARMYKSGDLGRWLPDGNVEYLGRNDFQIKLRGFRIELGEIETRLRQCHGVREAVVIAREDEQGHKRLVAYLKPQDGVELIPAELRWQLTQHLADHMLPSAFVSIDAFPLTSNGKLDTQALPAPEPSAFVLSQYESPCGEAEIALAQIWQKLLGLNQVSRHDHFFELGGHSLMIVSLIEELRTIGWQLAVHSVFASPHLIDMAQAIQRDTGTFVVPANRIPENCTAITPDLLPLAYLSQSEIDAVVATVHGGSANVQDIYPLAPLQEGILFHHLLQAEGDAYLLQVLLAFNTRVDLDAFLNALQQVIDRHDILRTAVYWQDLAQPVQVVWRQAPLSINTFTPATEEDVPAQLRLHTDPRWHRLDLTHAPLFAADIAYSPAQNEWLLALRFHHLVSDHMTLDLIFAEIAQILAGKTQSLPAPLPYRNFIAQTLAVSDDVHETYFREQLAGIDAPTAPFGVISVPKDFPEKMPKPGAPAEGDASASASVSTANNANIAKASLTLPPALADSIRVQARRLKVSPSVLFHAAWAQVVAQTSRRNDVVFGSVLLGRLQGVAGADQILGMFINTLPIRLSLSGRSVQDIVQDTYRNLTALLEHEQAPLSLAQRCSDVAQPMPLFSALLNYRHSQSSKALTADTADSAWATMRILEAKEQTNYPITLSVDDLGDDFQLTALTVAEIEPEQVTTYLATAITGLIDALVHNPQQLILDVPILPEAERQQLLENFNATHVDFPQQALIHQLVETQAAQNPDAIALTYAGQHLSYGELNLRANRLAHRLMALGVRPDDRVAICLERSLELIVGLLGILKAGGAYVPLDPTYPAERLAYMLEDATPVALLTQTSQVDRITRIMPASMQAMPIMVLDTHEPFLTEPELDRQSDPASPPTSRNLAYVTYTSGSTGLPKGVMIEHRNVVRLIINNGFADIGPDDCLAHCANISFDAATWEIWAALAHGARVLLIPEKTLLEPDQFGQCLSSEGVTALFLTTALFNQYANLIAPALSGLRYVLFGGERTDTRSAIRLRAENPPQHLLHVYGPTETTTFATAYEIPFMGDSDTDGERKIPIGHPISNTQIYILDEKGQPVPRGVEGEIHIGGAGVARGYLNRPELTAERFLIDPFAKDAEARMYKTGDLARWLPDGNIDYIGRNDFQVKLRGFRIELGEIEARLRQCDGVLEAVVLTREDEQGQKRLIAYLRPQAGMVLVPAELRLQLSQHLADYMLPSAFVMLEAFPLTPNGKIDRRALPDPDSSSMITRAYSAPIGKTEIALAGIWQDLLGVERVGRYDHFFELGGHSLLAVQLASRVRQVLARELPLQQLFDQPLLINLAQVLSGATETTQVAIPLADRQQPLPLSFAQQRLWFLGQLSPAASLAYHIPIALRFTGLLNRPALKRALDQLVARQEILRTRFELVAGQPCQHIDPADTGFALSSQDLRAQTPEAHNDRIAELTALEAQTPFDFTLGPLIRGHLLQLEDEEHVLLLTQHHIISDGWSMGVLMHELSVLYRAALGQQNASLPALPVQYADYAVWQRNRLQETVLAAQGDFWRAQLAGAPALLALPTDRPRPTTQSFIGGRIPIHFDADLLASLKALGQRHNATLFMTILSAWSIVLARLSGQDDIVIGTPVANRPHHELEGMIGFFVNTLALRVTLHDKFNVADLLAHVREQAFAAYAHQDLPFEQVVEALQPDRSLSYSPIFQVMLALNNTPLQMPSLPDLQLTTLEPEHHSAHFDLTLSLTETEAGLVGELAYAVDLFDAATIQRMMGYLTNVLTAMTVDEKQNIAILPMMSGADLQQLLIEFNANWVDFPQHALIHQRIEAQAAHQPDAIAIVCEGESLSYGELNRHANRLAHYLIAQGVRPDDRVAICVERSLEMVIGLLAILKSGGAYVPIDPSYPADRMAYMLEDSTPVAILTQSSLTDKLASELPTILLDKMVNAPAPFMTELPTDNPNIQALGLTANHLAYVIYTSGSTGKPKGVMVEHAHVVRLLAATQDHFQFDDQDVWTLFHSFAFDFSVWELWGALSYGGRLVIVSADCARSPQMFYSLLCHEQVTILNQTPSAFRQLIAAQDATPHALRCIIFGGEALELHTLAPWVARNPTQQTRLVNMYGITEITVHATYRELTESDIHSGRGSLIGQPLPDLRIYILDAYGQPVPLGVTGEIYIVGAGVARGYLNRPELTTERFLIDPFFLHSDSRMYKTGDLGRWLPDGNIEYLGRNDFQVKLRGFRIELGEIEARLEQCPGVREAVVLAREDEQGQKRLIAYLKPLDGAALMPAELRQQLSQHLAEYMLPSAFVTLDAFPLTSNGKLDRQALPAPDLSSIAVRNYQAPVGEMEITLAQIWQKLLKLESVGRHDHFFELGGHSLMIVSLIEELRNQGWQLDVRSVFITPVLLDMAQAVQQHATAFVVPANRIPANCTAITADMLPLVSLSQTEIEAIVATVPGGSANVQDIYPLAPLQEGILFHHLMQTKGDNYLLQSLLAFGNRERLDTFLAALQQVIDRHDILRTAAYWQELAQPVQVVWRRAPLEINLFTPDTSSHLAEHSVIEQLKAHTDPRQHRINLNKAPLFTADIAHDPAQDEWILALRFHHLVSDHMTLELIFAEIDQIQQGHAKMLPPALPYRNFVAQTLNMPTAEHEAYFREQFADIDEPTAPFGILKVKTDGEPVKEARLPLAPELADAIRSQARRLGISPGVLFHVAWAQVLAQTSGRDDVVFGSVLLGRLQGGAGAAQVLGMFINTLPMRLSLRQRTVQETVQDAYHGLMMLLEHEQAPLVLAQSCSGMAQSVPLFSTLLNYRHSQANEAETLGTSWTGIRVLTAEERTNYPITLSVDDVGNHFHLTAQTVAGIEPTRITAYLAAAIHGLIDALAHDPQQLIRNIPVLPITERQQLLVDFNATQTAFPQNSLIHQQFEAQAARRPDAIAVTFGDESLSYGELNRRANRLAHHLMALGIRSDDRVAICTERNLQLIVGLLAILKAGGAYVPLDPAYPAERLAYMLEDSAPVALLVQEAQAGKFVGAVPVADAVSIVMLDNEESAFAEQPADNPDAQTLGLNSHHLAYIIYTSGSTGLPKGVMVEHRNVLRLIINNGFADIGPDDCIAHCANIAFDASTWEIWSALLNGGRLHVVPQSVLLDPVRFCDSLIDGKVTALWLTSGLFNEYHHHLEPVFSQLRYLLTGGDVLDPNKIRAVQLAETQPAMLINGYGPTETTAFAATYAIPALVDVARPIPIGRPIANTQIYILDGYGEPVPLGATGEIHIGGMGVARGYLNRPELTAERFIVDPFSPEPNARLYKTGDLGRWLPDGNIEYLGRNDFQVKLRGFRIELGEIETRLKQCPGVRDAVVIMREDEPNQKRLVAYLQSLDGAELLPADLRQQLAQQLADYMLPSAFMTLDAFPLTPNGKLDRRALPAPDLSATISHGNEPPQGRIEVALAQIWQDLLGLEQVNRHDHFFEIGGHSLMVVRLITRIQHRFLVNISLSDLFISPTLAEQADLIFSTQMSAVGENEIESMQSSLDSMSAEELMAILSGEDVREDKDSSGDSK
ncbi:Amino acid adenylation [Xenorhabdus mauleonii]|uniref:Amino acid adenylation n=1 Tax=Xenorhabdus mauleonii TaxID=351675 RepID=A0A2G0NR94_9GAMM|nr:non-ribosomal peptide synthetase [Xenorhabdus mauleonii]PHM37254.1 Amino acid adenylation [Xenorhabdus mauleonii]